MKSSPVLLLILIFPLHPFPFPALYAQETTENISDRLPRSSKEPDNVHSVKDLADLLMQEGRYDEAAERYKEILTRNPDDVESRLALARVQSWVGRYDESIRNYEKLIEEGGDDGKLKLELARVLSWSGRYQEAIDLYRECLRSIGEDETIQIEYARVLSWSGDYKASSEAYDKLLAGTSHGGHKQERLELARVLSWGGYYERSREEYMKLLSDYPSEPAIYAGLGDLYKWAGRTDLARKYYRKSLEVDGTNPLLVESLASIDEQWNQVALIPGYDRWADSEGFALTRIEFRTQFHPWGPAVLDGAVEKGNIEQAGLSIDATSFALVLEVPLAENLKGIGGYRFTRYEEPGSSHGYTSKLEYNPNLTTTIGVSSSRNDIVTDVFNIRSLSGGIVQSQNLRTYLHHRSNHGIMLDLSGLFGYQSDGNRRKNVRAGLTYGIRNKPDIRLGYRLTYLGYVDRSDRYWDPRNYVSHMVLGRLGFEVGRTSYEIEGGIGRGMEDGTENNEYSLVLAGYFGLLPNMLLSSSYTRGRTGRLFEDSVYTFSRFGVKLSQRI